MSGLKELDKLNNRQLETLKRKNARETRAIEVAHDKYKNEIKKTNADEVVEIKNSHLHQVNSEAERKEKVLTEMRNHLDQTKQMTDKELKTLKENLFKDKAALQQKNNDDRARINGEHELYLEELNHRFNESSRNIASDGNKRIQEIKNLMHDQGREQSQFYQDKLHKQTEDFTTRYKTTEAKNQRMKDDQDNHFKKERMATNVRQQHEMAKMTETHTTHIEGRDTNYRKGLKEQDLFFEKKYEGQLARHNSEFKTLEDKNKKIVNGLKESLTKEITTYASKNQDPFFKFEALKPQMKQFEDRVEITVQVPEHSKEDMLLTINGKEAILNFNRRYTDANKTEDGTINKVNKVETFSSRLQTAHVLNPKSVKTTFDNGVMTFVVKKA